MSSVTTLITVRPHVHPLSATVGLTARTMRLLGLAMPGHVDEMGHGADDGLRVPVGDVTGVHMPVEQRREPLVARR